MFWDFSGGSEMKQELQERLFKKYPNIFQDKDKPMQQTCMCWGIECGDGWYNIIDNLCSNLSETVVASQVKEKFGGLRFYIWNGTDEDYDFIDKAERESIETCENCGSKEAVSATEGWISMLWKNCMEKRK